ncbi:pentapeptide repeat-containing protein [Planktothrix paucivesiculata]|uniref:Pentapeptide repeat protein n=1 Tax=Planktothrix paucivesiculata PCC 9631 TaxID=671071 RepID=A0A7Z9BKX6_9CYAN|nr:pentapeptide repeat-containing protein [Planktothrix paucivesiculata]VXD13289.1 Pentapeptide repeat protein [Planktothrix paucivesiculata PCC 9631]
MKILSTTVFGAATVLLLGLGVTTPAYSQNPNDLKQLLETRFCQGCDLRGANLSGAHLIGVDLRDANLTGANLANINLEGADLTGANLTSANLEGAFLNQTEFNDANLNGANLTNANLIQAQLDGANLLNADLTGTEFAIPTLQTAELPRGSAQDLGIPEELTIGRDPDRLVFPFGGPESDQPFEYNQEYLDAIVNPNLNSLQPVESDGFLSPNNNLDNGMRGDVRPSGIDVLEVGF